MSPRPPCLSRARGPARPARRPRAAALLLVLSGGCGLAMDDAPPWVGEGGGSVNLSAPGAGGGGGSDGGSDGGASDTGSRDSGSPDSGSPDSGSPDGGAPEPGLGPAGQPAKLRAPGPGGSLAVERSHAPPPTAPRARR